MKARLKRSSSATASNLSGEGVIARGLATAFRQQSARIHAGGLQQIAACDASIVRDNPGAWRFEPPQRSSYPQSPA